MLLEIWSKSKKNEKNEIFNAKTEGGGRKEYFRIEDLLEIFREAPGIFLPCPSFACKKNTLRAMSFWARGWGAFYWIVQTGLFSNPPPPQDIEKRDSSHSHFRKQGSNENDGRVAFFYVENGADIILTKNLRFFVSLRCSHGHFLQKNKQNKKNGHVRSVNLQKKKNGRKNISTCPSVSSGTFFGKKWAWEQLLGGILLNILLQKVDFIFSNEPIISSIFSSFLVDNQVCFWSQKIHKCTGTPPPLSKSRFLFSKRTYNRKHFSDFYGR